MGASIVGETFITTLRSVVTVFVVYLSGYVLVKTKVIDQKGIGYLAQLSNNLLVPALYVSRLGSSLSVETLKYAWPVLAISICFVFLSLGIAIAFLPFAQPSASFRKSFILGVAVSNVMAVPLVLVASLCSLVEFEKPSFFRDKESDLIDNSSNVVFSESECREVGELYIFLYTILVSFFVWTFGWVFIDDGTGRPVKHDDQQTKRGQEHSDTTSNISELEANASPNYVEGYSLKSQAVVDNQPVPTRKESDADKLCDAPEKKDKNIININSAQAQSYEEEGRQKGSDRWKTLGLRCFRILKTSFVRPINSSQIVGVFIGLIEPLQYQFFNSKGVLQPIMGGITILGGGAISLVNIIMACTVSIKLLSVESIMHLFGHEEKMGISRRTLIFYVFGKMLIIPGIHILILYLLNDYILPDDKLMQLVVYFTSITPTANMIIILAQILNQKQNAEIMAIGGLLQYLVATFTVTGYTFLILLLLGIA